MIEDQVLAEIRKIKNDLASQYGCDVRKMLNDAIIRQRNSEHRVVNLCMKRAKPALQRVRHEVADLIVSSDSH